MSLNKKPFFIVILLIFTLILDVNFTSAQLDCFVAPFQRANVRAEPTSSADVVAVIAANEPVRAIAQESDAGSNTWWFLELEGWIRSDVVDETGACTSLPSIEELQNPSQDGDTLSQSATPPDGYILLTGGRGLSSGDLLNPGEFQLEYYCEQQNLDTTNDNDNWYCTRDGRVEVTLTIVDFNEICRETYKNPEAIAVQSGSNDVPAFRWQCFAPSDDEKRVTRFSTPTSVPTSIPATRVSSVALAQPTRTPTNTPSPADDLMFGTVNQGILPRGEQVRWRFNARQGFVVSFVLQSADFDTYIEVYDPRGQLIAENDDSPIYEEETNSRIEDLTLNQRGVYTLVVRGYYGDATGDYGLIAIQQDSDAVDINDVSSDSEPDDTGILTPIQSAVESCVQDATNGILRVDCFCPETAVQALTNSAVFGIDAPDAVTCEPEANGQILCNLTKDTTEVSTSLDLIQQDTADLPLICLPNS